MFAYAIVDELDLSNWYSKNLVNASYMFADCKVVKDINVKGWRTPKLVDMSCMFSNSGVKKIDMRGFDTSNVQTMYGMFKNCEELEEVDMNGLNVENLFVMDGMFENCKNLKKVNLSGWNIKRVMKLSRVFADCPNLEEIDLTGWDTSHVFNMRELFFNCPNLKVIKGVVDMKSCYLPEMTFGIFSYSGGNLEELTVKNVDADMIAFVKNFVKGGKVLDENNEEI